MKVVETFSTIWLVDEDNRRYFRVPKSEDGSHGNGVVYSGEWHPYETCSIELFGGVRRLVFRDVHGSPIIPHVGQPVSGVSGEVLRKIEY